jgi:hypothetical protein
MAQGTTKGVPIDTDPLLANDSDLLVPSQKAIKTYVDTGLLTKQGALTLTTTGTSGASTLISNILNIPTYTLSGLGGWGITGNAGTTAGTNFIGTTDAIDFVQKANNRSLLRLSATNATADTPIYIQQYFGIPAIYPGAVAANSTAFSLLLQGTNTTINAPNGNTVLQGSGISNGYFGGLYSNIAKPMLINELATGTTAPSSLFQISKSGINATQSDAFGITLSTPDAATSGNPKYSPPIVFSGKSFNTGISASYDNLWRIYNKAASTVNFNLTGDLVFENSYNGGAYAERMRIIGGAGAAQLVVPSVATNTISAQSGATISISNRIYITDALTSAFVGAVYIGGNPGFIAASAALDVASTTKGFLPPRMTNAQRTAIASPAIGLMVYCTNAVEGLYVYKSTGWTFII